MKKLRIFGIAACILMLSSCGGGDTANISEVVESSSATLSETSETSEDTTTETEFESETETAADTTTVIEADTDETAAPKNADLTVSPSGYVLDPEIKILQGESTVAKDTEDDQPYLIAETEGGRVYGVFSSDKGKEWTAYNPTMEDEFTYSSYIIIEHSDKTADEFAGSWTTRFHEPMEVYCADFDGDGVEDIATHRYDTGGTFCCVMELAVYKMNSDGHYERFLFDNYDFIEEYITVEKDPTERIVRFGAVGSDKYFDAPFPDIVPEGESCGVSMGQVSGFELDTEKGEIKYVVTPFLNGGIPTECVTIKFTIRLNDGVFDYTDVEFLDIETF